MDEQLFAECKTRLIGSYSIDLPGARFKIGQKVLYRNATHTVLAVHFVDGNHRGIETDDTYEYILDIDWPLMVWEDEVIETDRVEVGDYVKIYIPNTDSYHVTKIIFAHGSATVIGDWYAVDYPDIITDGVYPITMVRGATKDEYLTARRKFREGGGL